MLTVPGITDLIPHRSTMLLVDRVLEFVPGERVVATKAVSYGEAWYRGVDGNASEEDLAYPYAILLESFNQACAVLVMATWQGHGTDVLDSGVPMLASYTDIRLGRTVLPGDVLEHRVEVIRLLDDAVVLRGETIAGQDIVLTAEHGVAVRRSAVTMQSPGR